MSRYVEPYLVPASGCLGIPKVEDFPLASFGAGFWLPGRKSEKKKLFEKSSFSALGNSKALPKHAQYLPETSETDPKLTPN